MTIFDKFYLCAAAGVGKTELSAFDAALLKCGIENFNLIKISSIIPPNSMRIEQIPSKIPFGSSLYCAYTFIYENKPRKNISSYIGVALPQNDVDVGVIMELSCRSHSEENREIVKTSLNEAMERRNIKEFTVAIEDCMQVTSDKNYHCTFAACILIP